MNDYPIETRPAVANDYGYLLETWSIQSHKVKPFNHIPVSIYKPLQADLIDRILKKVSPVIACLEDEPDTILGYLVAEPYDDQNLIVHWGNVKGPFRNIGIMRLLLHQFDYRNKNLICSHFFSLFEKLKDRYSLIYDPSILKRYE